MKYLIIVCMFCFYGCGEEEVSNASNIPTNNSSNIYCMGLSEVDISNDTVEFSISGNDVTLSKEMDGENFILTGSISMGETDIDIQIESDLNSSGSEGSFTLTVGAPLNMTVNSYAKEISCETDSVDEVGTGADQIVTTNPLVVGDISNISKFTSAAGHDSSDSFESCRSMKHYFEPISKTNSTNEVYAPFDGVVVSMNSEEGGGFTDDGVTNQLIIIKPSFASPYQISFYHIDVLPSLNLSPGDSITEGTLIGYGRLVRVNSDVTDPTAEPSASNDFDIKVEVLTADGIRAVSLFHIMSDDVFNEYNPLTSNISDLLISKTSRDADPLTCEGETFTSSGTLGSWLVSE